MKIEYRIVTISSMGGIINNWRSELKRNHGGYSFDSFKDAQEVYAYLKMEYPNVFRDQDIRIVAMYVFPKEK